MAADERERLESALTRRWLDLRESLDERSRTTPSTPLPHTAINQININTLIQDDR
jgi:hypothetical protein